MPKSIRLKFRFLKNCTVVLWLIAAVTVGTSSGLLLRLRATTCINLHCSKPSMISKVHISGAAGRPGKMNSKTQILRLSVNLPKNMPTVSAFLNICNLKPIASLNRLRPSLPSAGWKSVSIVTWPSASAKTVPNFGRITICLSAMSVPVRRLMPFSLPDRNGVSVLSTPMC